MLPDDPLRRVLYIDLTRRRSWVQERPDLFETALAEPASASSYSKKNVAGN